MVFKNIEKAVIILVLLFVSGCNINQVSEDVDNYVDTIKNNTTNETIYNDSVDEEVYTIELMMGNYHIDDFTISRLRNENTRNQYRNVFRDYDVLFVSGIPKSMLTEFTDIMLDIPDYDYTIRDDDGIIYAFLYNRRSIEIMNVYDYSSSHYKFDPFVIEIKNNRNKFVIVGVHFDKYDATFETRNLDNVFKDLEQKYNTKNIIVLGTMFNDCLYYDTDELENYYWILNENTHTSRCKFDRIITTDTMRRRVSRSGVKDDISMSSHYPTFVFIRN